MRSGRFRARIRQQRGLHAVLPAPHKIEELPIAKGNIPRTPGVREKHMRRSSVPQLWNMIDQFIRTIGSDMVPVSVRTGPPSGLGGRHPLTVTSSVEAMFWRPLEPPFHGNHQKVAPDAS